MDYMGRYMAEILSRFSYTSLRAFRLCGGGRSAVKLVDSLPLRRCKPTLSRRTRKAVEIPSCSHLAAAYFPPSPFAFFVTPLHGPDSERCRGRRCRSCEQDGAATAVDRTPSISGRFFHGSSGRRSFLFLLMSITFSIIVLLQGLLL